MDLESELTKLLNGRAASNDAPEPVVVSEAPLLAAQPAYADWTPAPWHREDCHQRDPFGDFLAA